MPEQTEEQAIRISIEDALTLVKQRDDIVKLTATDLWKEVIDKQYFEQEAIRLVAVKSEPHMQTADSQAYLDRMISGIGALRSHLAQTVQMGNSAASQIKEFEAELELVQNEPMEGVLVDE